jgi:hypothetical protein
MKLRSKVPALVVLMTLGTCAGAVAATNSTHSVRVWKERVTAPSQFDLTLAEVRFGAPTPVATPAASASHAASSMRLAITAPTGLDYVVGAVTRPALRGRPRALVLVVNRRPRGSLAPDLARIGFTVTAARGLGAPLVLQLSNPFTHPSTGALPALCNLPLPGVSLAAGDLRSVLSRGAALSGFSAETAIAQAYDVVCRRPYDPAFRQGVTQSPAPPCAAGQASIVSCCPPNAMCPPQPCVLCPCGAPPCAAPLAQSRQSAVVCPLQTPPIACPF